MQSLFLSLYWSLSLLTARAFAQVFNGPGLTGGVDTAAQIEGPVNGSLREIVLSYLSTVLDFLALAGVVMVVIAGFYMVLGNGGEESKEKAKKIILYTVIGIVIIFFARAVVGFFLYYLP